MGVMITIVFLLSMVLYLRRAFFLLCCIVQNMVYYIQERKSRYSTGIIVSGVFLMIISILFVPAWVSLFRKCGEEILCYKYDDIAQVRQVLDTEPTRILTDDYAIYTIKEEWGINPEKYDTIRIDSIVCGGEGFYSKQLIYLVYSFLGDIKRGERVEGIFLIGG